MTTEAKPQAGRQTGSDTLVRVATADEVHEAGCKVVHVAGHSIALFSHEGQVRAIDNRCPHMG